MQTIGRRYVGSFNARYRRTGTLWEGRFKSSLVGDDRYAPTCYRYIELNPVRASMVSTADGYRWSSHGRNAYGHDDPRVTPHPAYRSLGACDEARQRAYRTLFATSICSRDVDDLRLHAQQQRPWGNDKFREQIEALAQRAVGVRPRGRPRSSEK